MGKPQESSPHLLSKMFVVRLYGNDHYTTRPSNVFTGFQSVTNQSTVRADPWFQYLSVWVVGTC